MIDSRFDWIWFDFRSAASRIERECPNRKYVFERITRKRFRPSGSKEYFVANRTECEDRSVLTITHFAINELFTWIIIEEKWYIWIDCCCCCVSQMFKRIQFRVPFDFVRRNVADVLAQSAHSPNSSRVLRRRSGLWLPGEHLPLGRAPLRRTGGFHQGGTLADIQPLRQPDAVQRDHRRLPAALPISWNVNSNETNQKMLHRNRQSLLPMLS